MKLKEKNFHLFDKELDKLIKKYNIPGFCIFQKPDGSRMITATMCPEEVMETMQKMVSDYSYINSQKGNA